MIKHYFGIASVSPWSISITEDIDESSIPTFKDVWPKNNFELKGIMKRGNVTLDLTSMCEYGSIMFKEGDWYISTPLTKYFEALCQRSLLVTVSKDQHLTDLGKRRVKQEIEAIDRQIAEMGEQSILTSSIVLSAYRFEGSVVSIYSSDPIIDLLPPDSRIPLHEVPKYTAPYELRGATEATGLVETYLASILAPYKVTQRFTFKIDTSSSQLSLDKTSLEFIVHNRHKLMGCSDLLYNMVLPSMEYDQKELASRGIVLKTLLDKMSDRYPISSDNVKVMEFARNTRELANLMGYELNSVFDDVEYLKVVESSKSMVGCSPSYSTLACVILASSAEGLIKDGNNLKFKWASDYIVVEGAALYIDVDDDFDTWMRIIRTVNGILFGGLKINIANANYMVDCKHLVCRLNRSFRVG